MSGPQLRVIRSAIKNRGAHSRARRQVYQCYWEQVGCSTMIGRGTVFPTFPPSRRECSFRCSFVVVFLLVLLRSERACARNMPRVVS